MTGIQLLVSLRQRVFFLVLVLALAGTHLASIGLQARTHHGVYWCRDDTSRFSLCLSAFFYVVIRGYELAF